MQRRLIRVAVATAIACVVLAPALIWSGQRSQPAQSVAGGDFDLFKETPVFTVGPPMSAEALAAREAEKRLSLPEAEARARELILGSSRSGHGPSQTAVDRTSPGSVGGPDLTPAELQKLDAIRRGALVPRDDRTAWPRKLDLKPETIDAPLRPPGAEGLTPGERAKLETSRDEGGRSK